MNIIRIQSLDSTNAWVARNLAELPRPAMVWALCQTAGRGQRGNSWEAEPGMNLTASFLISPHGIRPDRQFLISEAIALAVIDFLRELNVAAYVKWPNDIYVGDRKICGILIENAILGQEITRSIAGVGINLNQKRFISDAPNPVSVANLTGKETDLPTAAEALARCVEARLNRLLDGDGMHEEYISLLWRGDGAFYPFADRKSGLRFMAAIAGVEPDGILSLRLPDGDKRTFAFKEVEFLLHDTQNDIL